MTLFETEMKPEVLERFLDHAYRHTKIRITPGKKSMMQGRVRSRANKLNLSSYDEYLAYLERHPEEVQEFINVITTNETSFYRTPRVWEYFSKSFLPSWFSAHPGQGLRIWSAAASSGEEPCTIAILCQEFKSQNPQFQFRILATDISTAVLKKAQQGVFAGRSLENIKAKQPHLFAKYFRINGEGHSVDASLLSAIRFQSHDLFQPLRSADRFDIVFLRNVLIYFGAKDQEQVLSNITKSMQRGATLILGESESLNGLNTAFRFVEPLVYQESAADN